MSIISNHPLPVLLVAVLRKRPFRPRSPVSVREMSGGHLTTLSGAALIQCVTVGAQYLVLASRCGPIAAELSDDLWRNRRGPVTRLRCLVPPPCTVVHLQHADISMAAGFTRASQKGEERLAVPR
jgi:hypothetical protein